MNIFQGTASDNCMYVGYLSPSDNFTWDLSTGLINYQGLEGKEGSSNGVAYSDLYNLFKAIEEGSAKFVKAAELK